MSESSAIQDAIYVDHFCESYTNSEWKSSIRAFPSSASSEAGIGHDHGRRPTKPSHRPAAGGTGAAQEAANRIHQETERFVADCVSSLRELTAALCDEMLESIRTSETGVHQKTLNRLVRFIDQFRQMNFAGDSQMEQQLENVRRELLSRTAEQYRDDAFARERLGNGLNRLATEARQLAQQDAAELVQRFGELGRRKFHLAA